MVEILVFLLAFGADQAVKYWSMTALAALPGQQIVVIPGVFWLQYAENYADNVSFLRGRSIVMNIVRLLQLALVLYLLIAQRQRMKPITRFALVLFLAGMLGNQINYLTMQFVPDMFVLGFIQGYVFNLADVFVMVAMVILFFRLLFFEGQDLVNWMTGSTGKKKASKMPNEIDALAIQPTEEVLMENAEERQEAQGKAEK